MKKFLVSVCAVLLVLAATSCVIVDVDDTYDLTLENGYSTNITGCVLYDADTDEEVRSIGTISYSCTISDLDKGRYYVAFYRYGTAVLCYTENFYLDRDRTIDVREYRE